MTPTRYAIYYIPPKDALWAGMASAWLGWDCRAGVMLDPPDLGLHPSLVKTVTETPRRYGLHATLKPPFRLADGHCENTLFDACAALAERCKATRAEGLSLARLGRFFALRPNGDQSGINALAAACVTELDGFRAPATEAEIEKRRQSRLSPEQDAHLLRWGYPYVLDQFRFHITLTQRLAEPERSAIGTALQTHLVPLLPDPFEITQIALAAEDAHGRFRHLQSFPLGG